MKKKNTSPVRQSPSQSSATGSRSSQAHLAHALALAPAPSGSPSPASVSSWVSSLRLPGQFSRPLHQQHRSLSLQQVLAAIRARVCRQWGFTEVVGQWVWVHASDTLTLLERAWLFELGFHYSPRRLAWQHPCGVPSSPSRQPFAKYFPAEQSGQPLEFLPHF